MHPSRGSSRTPQKGDSGGPNGLARAVSDNNMKGHKSRRSGDGNASLAQFVASTLGVPLVLGCLIIPLQSNFAGPLLCMATTSGGILSVVAPARSAAGWVLRVLIVVASLLGFALMLEVHMASRAGVTHTPTWLNEALPIHGAEQQPMVGLWPSSGSGVKLETISVVLPCAFEGNFAAKTVKSIWESTDHKVLQEIIVVDDGSKPRLETLFPKYLLEGPDSPPLRFVRNEQTLGLIKAKLAGGNAAVGDVIMFLDCHVKPREGWEKAILRTMARHGDHRTIAVPGIGSLDASTWKEVDPKNAHKACYLLWNADFTWVNEKLLKHDEIPIASGGLLAISRQWWTETGGYDESMEAWGGENLDQSLRAWLCGGRILGANDAYIAHMWRDPKKPETQLKYPIPTHQVMRNKARAVTAWFDEFAEKPLSFPEYENFKAGGTWTIGDMSGFDALKTKLKCKPFATYLQKFSHLYLDGGLIPREVFQLRELSTGKCLERLPREKQPHGVILTTCARRSSDSAKKQIWHEANGDPVHHGKCCSGIANQDFLQCLDSQGAGYGLSTFECELGGWNQNQHFSLSDGNLLRRNVGCVAPAATFVAALGHSSHSACKTIVEMINEESFRLKAMSPDQNQEIDGSCAVAAAGTEVQSQVLKFAKCDADDPQQIFTMTPLLEGFMIGVGTGGQCLDAGGGNGEALVYPCYKVSDANRNQMWTLRAASAGKHLCWGQRADGYCIDFTPLRQSDTAARISLETCATKKGQEFRRKDPRGDGTFLLHAPASELCLGLGKKGGHGQSSSLSLGKCDEKQRWRMLQSHLTHVDSKLCVDGGLEEGPTLYPCHKGFESRVQSFIHSEESNSIQMLRGWEDNGRKRYFEQCLDHDPVPAIELTFRDCKITQKHGIRWERLDAEESVEYKAWLRSKAKMDKGFLQ